MHCKLLQFSKFAGSTHVCRSAVQCVDRFIVPEDKLEEFEACWHEREEFMQQMPGFLGFSMEQQDGSNFVTTSK